MECVKALANPKLEDMKGLLMVNLENDRRANWRWHTCTR